MPESAAGGENGVMEQYTLWVSPTLQVCDKWRPFESRGTKAPCLLGTNGFHHRWLCLKRLFIHDRTKCLESQTDETTTDEFGALVQPHHTGDVRLLRRIDKYKILIGSVQEEGSS